MKRFIKNLSILTLLLVFTNSNLFSEQSFSQVSANTKNVYYGVATSMTIVETGTPTDFHISVGSGTIWNQISNTFGWGQDFSPSGTFSWTPDTVLTSVAFGLNTGERNSGTFSTLPTDTSDVNFDVLRSSITFSEMSEIWYDDIFYFEWDADYTTLPKNLVFQYREIPSGTWTTIDTFNITSGAITFHNEHIMSDVKFRFTYEGSEFGYPIGETETITYVEPSLMITNKSEITNKVWDDDTSITMTLESERLSDYYNLSVYKVTQTGLSKIGEISKNDSTFIYQTAFEFTGNTTLQIKTPWGLMLDEVTFQVKHKYFELSPLDVTYSVNDVVEFYWSYSDNFMLSKIEVERNSNTMYDVLNANWNLATGEYTYPIKDTDTSFTFKFTVADDYDTLIVYTNPVFITEHCKSDSLKKIIEEQIAYIDSLETMIENYEPEYIYYLVSIIKDIPNSVEFDDTTGVTDIEQLTVVDGRVELSAGIITHLYVADVNGNIMYENINMAWYEGFINVSNYSTGVYFIVAFDESDLKPMYYKFIIE